MRHELAWVWVLWRDFVFAQLETVIKRLANMTNVLTWHHISVLLTLNTCWVGKSANTRYVLQLKRERIHRLATEHAEHVETLKLLDQIEEIKKVPEKVDEMLRTKDYVWAARDYWWIPPQPWKEKYCVCPKTFLMTLSWFRWFKRPFWTRHPLTHLVLVISRSDRIWFCTAQNLTANR